MTVCFDGTRLGASVVEFARELAGRAAQFAAEVERLHAQQSQDSSTGDVGAGSGEAA